MTTNNVWKIDTHAHYIPSVYKAFLEKDGTGVKDGFKTPEWSPELQIKLMDENKIAYAMLTISSPNMNDGDDEAARKTVRACNEESAEICEKYSNRLGFLASLPLPNVEYAVEELIYAMDHLGAQGIGTLTNTSGLYLGDRKLDPLMEELNRRHCVVHIHPTAPSAVPANVNEGLHYPALEYFFDTTRTVYNMILKDTFNRYPNIKWIVPHAGAFIPTHANRFNGFTHQFKFLPEGQVVDVFRDLGNLYYDVAGNGAPTMFERLLAVSPIEHILYGADYPYTPDAAVAKRANDLETTKWLSDEDKVKVYQKNAVKLFPKLAGIDFPHKL